MGLTGNRNRRQDQRRSDSVGREPQALQIRNDPRVGDDRIQSQGRNEPSDLLQMSMRGKARGFTWLGSNIQDENALS